MQVQFLGWEDPLEEEMAIHSSTIAWKIPWTEEPGQGKVFVTLWTAAHQAPPSMGFSRQEHWCEFPLPSPAFVLSGLIYSILDLLSSRPTHFLIF